MFRSLDKDDMKKIVTILSQTLVERCKAQMNITLSIKDSVKVYIVEKGYEPKYGARPLRRKIQNEIEDTLAEEILEGKIKKGDFVDVGMKKGEICFTVKKEKIS